MPNIRTPKGRREMKQEAEIARCRLPAWYWSPGEKARGECVEMMPVALDGLDIAEEMAETGWRYVCGDVSIVDFEKALRRWKAAGFGAGGTGGEP